MTTARITSAADTIKDKVDSLESDFQKYVAGSEAAIQKVVREEVEREVERWKLAVGAASKLLAVAVVLVGGLLTLFALKTAHDVSLATINAVHDEVARKIGSDDATSPLNTALTRALVDSYLISMERNRTLFAPKARVPSLSPVALARLIAAFQDKLTKEADFRDITEVLAATEGTDSWQTAFEALAGAVVATERPYVWLRDQPGRRTFVLFELNKTKGYKGETEALSDRLQSAVRSLASDKSNVNQQIAAIRYLGSHGSSSDVPSLDQVAKDSQDENVRIEAGYALAVIQPSSEQCTLLREQWSARSFVPLEDLV